MKTDALDQYLAQCVQSFVRSSPAPPWPSGLDAEAGEIAMRVTFHGIALLLVEASPGLPGWPEAAAELVKEEARLQSFWEMSHREVMGQLIEALHVAEIPALILKGTALAYSVYPKPEFRRRGDSDLLIEDADRAQTRKVFEACGFSLCSDVRPLQECWRSQPKLGFDHTIDLHWRISASSAISGMLETNLPRRKSVALPHLSQSAQGIGIIDNLILVCVNRALHGRFGYVVGNTRLIENDRLIWALDIDLLTARFGLADWKELAASASDSGTSDIVHSALRMAQKALGSEIPALTLKQLEEQSGDARFSDYLSCPTGRKRLMLDLAASPTWGEKLRLLSFKLHPSDDLIHERFPDADGWPVAALRARRLLSGVGSLLRGRS